MFIFLYEMRMMSEMLTVVVSAEHVRKFQLFCEQQTTDMSGELWSHL